MSTDRELLELAAKATGLVIDKSPYNGGGKGNTGFDLMGNAVLDWHNGKTWDPLTDDGDALRLAVKLGLSVEIDNCDDETRVGECGCEMMVKHMHFDASAEAATRRAIVRAAAEIGKAMP